MTNLRKPGRYSDELDEEASEELRLLENALAEFGIEEPEIEELDPEEAGELEEEQTDQQ